MCHNQIEEVVTYIEGKLAELDEERAELAEFQSLDKQRRSIEYALLDKDLTDTRTKLDKVRGRGDKILSKIMFHTSRLIGYPW